MTKRHVSDELVARTIDAYDGGDESGASRLMLNLARDLQSCVAENLTLKAQVARLKMRISALETEASRKNKIWGLR